LFVIVEGHPVNVRPNVFSDVLKPSPDRQDLTALQLELHSRTTRTVNQYKVILNSMRVIGVFDWLLATKQFLTISLEDPFKKGNFKNSKPALHLCKWYRIEMYSGCYRTLLILDLLWHTKYS